VVSRMRAELQVDIAVRSIFDHPTVSSLSELIETLPKMTTRNLGPVPRPRSRTVASAADLS
jgi:hypothetical protein